MGWGGKQAITGIGQLCIFLSPRWNDCGNTISGLFYQAVCLYICPKPLTLPVSIQGTGFSFGMGQVLSHDDLMTF